MWYYSVGEKIQEELKHNCSHKARTYVGNISVDFGMSLRLNLLPFFATVSSSTVFLCLPHLPLEYVTWLLSHSVLDQTFLFFRSLFFDSSFFLKGFSIFRSPSQSFLFSFSFLCDSYSFLFVCLFFYLPSLDTIWTRIIPNLSECS